MQTKRNTPSEKPKPPKRNKFEEGFMMRDSTNTTDIQIYALQKVAEKLEQIIYKYGFNRSIDEIDRSSWKQHVNEAQKLIDTYNDAINSFNLPDGE